MPSRGMDEGARCMVPNSFRRFESINRKGGLTRGLSTTGGFFGRMFVRPMPGALHFYLLSQLQPQIYPPIEKPPKSTRLHCTPSLQSMLHTKAVVVNSTTVTIICIVLDKQHWTHKRRCQYIQYNSAVSTDHKP